MRYRMVDWMQQHQIFRRISTAHMLGFDVVLVKTFS